MIVIVVCLEWFARLRIVSCFMEIVPGCLSLRCGEGAIARSSPGHGGACIDAIDKGLGHCAGAGLDLFNI
jgi:hypothetical protein